MKTIIIDYLLQILASKTSCPNGVYADAELYNAIDQYIRDEGIEARAEKIPEFALTGYLNMVFTRFQDWSYEEAYFYLIHRCKLEELLLEASQLKATEFATREDRRVAMLSFRNHCCILGDTALGRNYMNQLVESVYQDMGEI